MWLKQTPLTLLPKIDTGRQGTCKRICDAPERWDVTSEKSIVIMSWNRDPITFLYYVFTSYSILIIVYWISKVQEDSIIEIWLFVPTDSNSHCFLDVVRQIPSEVRHLDLDVGLPSLDSVGCQITPFFPLDAIGLPKNREVDWSFTDSSSLGRL